MQFKTFKCALIFQSFDSTENDHLRIKAQALKVVLQCTNLKMLGHT